MLGRVLASIVMVALAVGSARGETDDHPPPALPLTNEQLFPHGHAHWSRCWQLEHDYYALRDQIAHTGWVWRRQQLELLWEQVREQRRESCLMGW